MLVAAQIVGCSEETAASGGTGGSGDTGGDGGSGGVAGNPFPCEAEGSLAPCDGTLCPCTLDGIRGAVAEGGGPYTFDCEGSTIIASENAPGANNVIIDNDVQLDGEGNILLAKALRGSAAKMEPLTISRCARLEERSAPFGGPAIGTAGSGAGAMFDLGWGRVGPRKEFVSSEYLRALLYWRLRAEAL